LTTIVVCPQCGNHFDRPYMTEKRSGLGLTIGPLGAIKCPGCGFKAGWGTFKKEKDVPPGFGVGPSKPKTPPSNPEDEKDKNLDETKYEPN
jgi:hypothetical protein